MKTLIVYYSRTGTTKKVANELAKQLKCTTEEITEEQDRNGVIGYLKSGREAMKKLAPPIDSIDTDLTKFDTIIIGTPVWAHKISSPVRTFIKENKDSIKKTAFFCTMGGSGAESAFKDLEEELGKKPKATLTLKNIEVKKGEHKEKLKEFIKKLK